MREAGNFRVNNIQQASTYLTDTGTADTYVVDTLPSTILYTPGLQIHFKATNANTGASTLNVSGLGAKLIKKSVTQDLVAGDIIIDQIVDVIYDGINFQMIGGPNAFGTVGISTLDTNTVDHSGDGTLANPLFSDVRISTFPGNAITALTDGIWSSLTNGTEIEYGGILTWITGYSYDVSAAGYYINGVFYTSPETPITLSPADPVLDRVDTIAVDVQGQVVVIEGTPAANPQQPSVDPEIQAYLTFVLVKAGTTQPPGVVQECMYKEHLEWTTTAAASYNPDSLSFPWEGIKDIEGTNTTTGNGILLTNPGGAFAPIPTFTNLTFRIRPKTNWGNSNRRLILRWELGGVPTGVAVNLMNGFWGYDTSNTTSYQLITIPLSNFGLSTLTLIDSFRITTQTNSAIGFYIDNICIQNPGSPNPPPPSGGSGFSGYSGRSGYSGYSGFSGISGYSGSNPGVSGYSGYSGANPGASGYSGYSGANPGASGYSGYSGFSGGSGYSGYSGISGYSGSNPGASGYSGYSGANPGQSGYSGYSGANPGESGYSGYSGKSGYSGYSGGVGISGFSGFSGSGASITADNGLGMSTPTNVQLGGTLLHHTTVDTTAAYIMNFTGQGLFGPTVHCINTGASAFAVGVKGAADQGVGVFALTNSGVALHAAAVPLTDNTVVPVIKVEASNSVAGANGMGGSIDYYTSTTTNSRLSNQLISKWTTATDASRVSEFSITGVDAASTSTLFTLAGSGQLKLNKYGSGTFTGTAAKWLAVTSAGLVIEENAPSGISSITADNGLTTSSSTNVRLGGTSSPGSALLHNTFINTDTFKLELTGTWTGSTAAILYANNTSTTGVSHGLYGRTVGGSGSAGVRGEATAGNVGVLGTSGTGGLGVKGSSPNIAVYAEGGTYGVWTDGSSFGVYTQSTNGYGVYALSGAGNGIYAQSGNGAGTAFAGNFKQIATNVGDGTTKAVINLVRTQAASITAGFGTSIDFSLVTDTLANDRLSNQIISRWTTITEGSQTSQLIIKGVNNATTDDLLKLGDRVTLTESTATVFATTTVASGKIGGGHIVVTVEANDGTDYQSRTLRFIWTAVNKAGTTTIAISTPEEVVAVSAGTLTVTITAVDAGSGVVQFKADAASSLTQTTLRATYQISKNF